MDTFWLALGSLATLGMFIATIVTLLRVRKNEENMISLSKEAIANKKQIDPIIDGALNTAISGTSTTTEHILITKDIVEVLGIFVRKQSEFNIAISSHISNIYKHTHRTQKTLILILFAIFLLEVLYVVQFYILK